MWDFWTSIGTDLNVLQARVVLFHALSRFFKQYDTNANGVLEYAEVERVANDLFLTLGISLDEERLRERILAYDTLPVLTIDSCILAVNTLRTFDSHSILNYGHSPW